MTTVPWGSGHDIGSGLGRIVRLCGSDGVVGTSSDSFTDWYAVEPALRGTAYLGRTCTVALPVTVRALERHAHDELIIPTNHPLAVLLTRGGDEAPDATTALAVTLTPEEALVIAAGTWHSAAYGLDRATTYHWLGGAADPAKESWIPLPGNGIHLGDQIGVHDGS